MSKLFSNRGAIIAMIANLFVSVLAYLDIQIDIAFATQYVEVTIQILTALYTLVCLYINSEQN